MDEVALELEVEENVTETQEILVHISGCVKENKVVSLPDGSRVNDAIEAAGGLTKDADLTNVNLAYILEDGERFPVASNISGDFRNIWQNYEIDSLRNERKMRRKGK